MMSFEMIGIIFSCLYFRLIYLMKFILWSIEVSMDFNYIKRVFSLIEINEFEDLK